MPPIDRSACAAASRAIVHGVPILIGLGVDELSVSLPAIPAVKAQIRNCVSMNVASSRRKRSPPNPLRKCAHSIGEPNES